MPALTVFAPGDLDNEARPADLSHFPLQFLAQGDSWFSLGALPPFRTTNLFDGMATRTLEACAVNCARPGARLAVMADTTRAPVFLRLLRGRAARRWSGLLLSGGGNDLILAASSGPSQPPALRLLATRDEWTTAPGGERYLCNAGWLTFATHLEAVFRGLLAARDDGPNRGIPVVLHTYDIAVPRPCGAGLGTGPWLQPALAAFGIPPDDRPGVARALMHRLATLLDHLAATTPDGSVHVVHTQGTLVPASPTDTGPTADWENEIHPTPAGYRRLSAVWGPVLDAVFGDTVQPPPPPAPHGPPRPTPGDL